MVTKIELYESLIKKLGEKTAKQVVEYIDFSVEAKKQDVATKADIESVRKEIHQSKVDVIKWMFAFWIATIGILLLNKLI